METNSLIISGVTLVLGFVLGWLVAVVRRPALPSAEPSPASPSPAEVTATVDLAVTLGQVSHGVALIGRQVTELEKERVGQFAALGEQLRQAALNDQQLAQATGALTGALKSNQARGTWGEVELRRVLELSGLSRHIDFAEQRSFDGASARPDVTVSLPGGGLVAVDSKVPMAAYLEASGSSNPDMTAHAKALRSHIDALAKKDYPTALASAGGAGANLGFTVMFLPMESLLAEALQADPNLLDYALSRSITPATPASLLALLKAVALMWRHAAVSDQASQLLELGQTMYQRLGVLSDHVGKLGNALQSTVSKYNQMVGSLENRVLAACRAFEGMDASGLEVTQLPPENSTVRSIER